MLCAEGRGQAASGNFEGCQHEHQSATQLGKASEIPIRAVQNRIVFDGQRGKVSIRNKIANRF